MRAALVALLAACAKVSSAAPSDGAPAGIEITGELVASDPTEIVPPTLVESTSFKVAWLAPDGSDVAAGDVVVKLDPEELTHTLESVRNDVASAEQRLAKQRDAYALARRDEELRLLEAHVAAKKAQLRAEVPADLMSGLDAHERTFDHELAEMDLADAERSTAFSRRSDDADLQDLVTARDAGTRRIADIERSIAQLDLTAPRPGTVIYPGDDANKRKVGDGLGATEKIVDIVGAGALHGLGDVDELDIGRVAIGKDVALVLDALPDTSLHASVATITKIVLPRSDRDPSKIVRIELALAGGAPPGLRAGMRFHGWVQP